MAESSCGRLRSRRRPRRCASLLGFPLALFIARSGTRKNLYLSLVILPFWTSFLIRLYAWMFLLRDTGSDQYRAPIVGTDPRAAAAAL